MSNLKSHLGLQFIDENGVRHESWQLLNAAGYAIATADFCGSILTRFLYADTYEAAAKEWLAKLRSKAMSTTYVLQAPDGRWATYDTRSGPSLTRISGLRYTWSEKAKAEQQRPLYEAALQVQLTVEAII